MASGKVHQSVSAGAAIGIVFSIAASHILELNAGVAVGTALGILISPDLDVDDGNRSHYYMRKVLLGWWWGAIWKPYALIFSHRGFSHFPIISTIIRLIYFPFPVIMIVTSIIKNQRVYRLVIAQIASIPVALLFLFLLEQYPTALLSVAVGLIFSDILHILFDI